MKYRSLALVALCVCSLAAFAGCDDNRETTSGNFLGDSTATAGSGSDAGSDSEADGDSEVASASEAGSAAEATGDSKFAVAEVAVDRTRTLSGKVPAKNDNLLLAYAQDPDTLNPITSNDTVSNAFQRLVLEPLAERDMTDPDKWVPRLATHWEFDPETLTYTIHLRKGVKWHPIKLPNGRELPEAEFTADDVKFTFDSILNPNVQAGHVRSYYENPDAKTADDRYKIEVDVIDDYTLEVRWKQPYFMSDDYTLGVLIAPRHVYSVDQKGDPISFDFSSLEFAKGFNEHWASTRLCGTGPMRFREWRRDERLVLDRNPDYWGEPFYFNTLTYECIPNSNTMYQKGLAGELDLTGVSEKELYTEAKKHRNVLSGKVRTVEFPYPAYRYIGYNLQHPFLKEQPVRMAISHAVPVQAIIDKVFLGMAEPVNGPFLAGSSACDSTIAPIPFDLNKARQLLEDAGWKDTDGDGVRDKLINGQKVPASFELNIYSESPSFATVAQILQDNLRRVGVDMKVTPQKWALMLDRLKKKQFDASMLGWAMDWKTDPFQLFHGSQAEIPDSSNHVGYANPEVDRLIVQLRETVDPDEQIKLYHQIHRLIFDDQPYTFLFSEKQTALADSRLEGLEFYMIRPCFDSRRWSSTRTR